MSDSCPPGVHATHLKRVSAGALYLISTFYKREELAVRNSIFYIGAGLAGATTGLLAYGLLPLGDKHPALHGWQYLMIGEFASFAENLLVIF